MQMNFEVEAPASKTGGVLAPKWTRFAEARNVRAGGAAPPRGRRLPVFMRMGAHRAHELLSRKSNVVLYIYDVYTVNRVEKGIFGAHHKDIPERQLTGCAAAEGIPLRRG